MHRPLRGSRLAAACAALWLIGTGWGQNLQPATLDDLFTETALTRRMERLRPTIESFLGDSLGASISVRPATYAELRARIEEKMTVESILAASPAPTNEAAALKSAIERRTFQAVSDSSFADATVLISRTIVNLVGSEPELETVLDFFLAVEAAHIYVDRRLGGTRAAPTTSTTERTFAYCVSSGFADWLAFEVAEKIHGLVLTQRAATIRRQAELYAEPTDDEDFIRTLLDVKDINRVDGRRFMTELIDRLGRETAITTAFQRPPNNLDELLDVDRYLDPVGIVFDAARIAREIDVALGIATNRNAACREFERSEMAVIGIPADALFVWSAIFSSSVDGKMTAGGAMVRVYLSSSESAAEALARRIFTAHQIEMAESASHAGALGACILLDQRPGENAVLERVDRLLDRRSQNGRPLRGKSTHLVAANGRAVVAAQLFHEAAVAPALIETCRRLASTLADPPKTRIARDVRGAASRAALRPSRRFFGRIGYRGTTVFFPSGTAYFFSESDPTRPIAVALEKGEFSFTAAADRAILGRVVVDGQSLRGGIGKIVEPDIPFTLSIHRQTRLRLRLIDAETNEPIPNAVVVRMKRIGRSPTLGGDLGVERVVCRPARRRGFVESTDARGEILIDSDEQPIDLEVGSPRHVWRRVVVLTAPVKELEVALDRGPNLLIRLDGGGHDRDVALSLEMPATFTKPGEAVDRWFTAAEFDARSESGTFDLGAFPNGRCRVTLRDPEDRRIVDRVESDLVGDDPQTVELSTDGFRSRSPLDVVFRISEKWRAIKDRGALVLTAADAPDGTTQRLEIVWPTGSPFATARVPSATPGPLALTWNWTGFEFTTDFLSRRDKIEFTVPDPVVLSLEIVDDQTGKTVRDAVIQGRRLPLPAVGTAPLIDLPRLAAATSPPTRDAVDIFFPAGATEVLVGGKGYATERRVYTERAGSTPFEKIRLKKSATLELEITYCGKIYSGPVTLRKRDGSGFRDIEPLRDPERPGIRLIDLEIGQNMFVLEPIGKLSPPMTFTIIVRGGETIRKSISLDAAR